MHDWLGHIAHVLLPASDERVLLRQVNEAHMEAFVEPKEVHGAMTLAAYAEPAVRAAVIATKFQNDQRAARLLAHLLSVWMHNAEPPNIEKAWWIPVPLSGARQRERGYNQAERILRACPDVPTEHIRTNVLKRTRDTQPQSSLDKDERQENVAEAFALTRAGERELAGAHVVLFDDVVTSGATMRAAKAALSPPASPRAAQPASITCLAIAR